MKENNLKEFGLQDLIYQVKRKLLAPNPAERARDPYPLFFIDKIELEIAVKLSESKDGSLKLTVLNFAELGGGGSVDREKGHVIKVSLSPILSREAILANVMQDEQVRKMIQTDSQIALVKGESGMVGEPE